MPSTSTALQRGHLRRELERSLSQRRRCPLPTPKTLVLQRLRRATLSRTRSTTRTARPSRTPQPQTCNIRQSWSYNNQQSTLTKCQKATAKNSIHSKTKCNNNNSLELRQKQQNRSCCRHQWNLILQLLFVEKNQEDLKQNCCFWSQTVSGYISFSSFGKKSIQRQEWPFNSLLFQNRITILPH